MNKKDLSYTPIFEDEARMKSVKERNAEFTKKQLKSQLFVLEYSMKKMKIDFDILKKDIKYYKEKLQNYKEEKNEEKFKTMNKIN